MLTLDITGYFFETQKAPPARLLLTGGLARSEYIVSRLRERIGFLAPIRCFPGEDEMEALALNALAVLRGKRKAKEYK